MLPCICRWVQISTVIKFRLCRSNFNHVSKGMDWFTRSQTRSSGSIKISHLRNANYFLYMSSIQYFNKFLFLIIFLLFKKKLFKYQKNGYWFMQNMYDALEFPIWILRSILYIVHRQTIIHLWRCNACFMKMWYLSLNRLVFPLTVIDFPVRLS